MAKGKEILSRRQLILGLTFIFASGLLIGYLGHSITSPPITYHFSEDFTKQSLKDMRMEILSEIDFAVSKAEAEGTYNCCVDPPCRICFVMEGECNCKDELESGGDVCEECRDRLAGR